MQPVIPLWLIYFSGVCDDIKSFFFHIGGVELGVIIFAQII